jgi:hypothetical protein
LDVDRLLAQLVRYVGGEWTAFRVVRVPNPRPTSIVDTCIASFAR